MNSGTILVVDDDADEREMLDDLLRSQGYRLLFAVNGFEALAQAVSHTPDLVLLDVMMPGLDGFEVCQRLRADPRTAEIPIIFITALDDRDSRLRGINAGADDFISKPFDRIELRSRARTITRLNRYRRLLDERARFEQLYQLSLNGLLIVDRVGLVRLANPALLALAAVNHDQLIVAKPVFDLIVPDRQDAFRSWLRPLPITRPSPARHETVLACRDGTRRPVEVDAGSLSWEGQLMTQLVVRDITDRKRAELLEQNRLQIGYDLRDGIAPLAQHAFDQLNLFVRQYHPRSEHARGIIAKALDGLNRVVEQTYRLIKDLSPTPLDDLGLAIALRTQADALRASGWNITYQDSLDDQQLPPDIELALFRLAEESFAALKQYGTTEAQLAVVYRDQTVRLEIQALTVLASSEGLPELVDAHDRIALVGGKLTLLQNADGHTTIVAEIPLTVGRLTPREREVLRLVAQGRTNREIAEKLVVSVGTVKNHVEHIIAKLGVSDRTQAAVYALRSGLLHGG